MKRVLLMSVLAIGIGPHPARPQLLQGTIDGNVTDPSQAAIAGATVTATNQDTGFARDTLTNSSGGYSLPTLPPGTYTIKVVAPGFQTYTQTGAIVAINNVTRVDVTLTVGQVSESLTVAAQAATLQTDRADVRTDMTAQALNSLPVPLGRNYQMLLPAMVPGVATPVSGGSFAANPVSVAAGIATLRDVLTREVYPSLFTLNQRLAEGYDATLRREI